MPEPIITTKLSEISSWPFRIVDIFINEPLPLLEISQIIWQFDYF